MANQNYSIQELKKYTKIISILVVLISFSSSNQWSKLPVGNELFWWIIFSLFIYILLIFKTTLASSKSEIYLKTVKYYLIWNIIEISRGALTADNYWEWKALISTSFLLLLPLIVYVSDFITIFQIIIRTWFKYGLLIFIFFSPFLFADAVGKFLMPITFLILFYPILDTKWKFILLIFTIYTITFDITARSNLIKFVVPFLISLLFYFKSFLNNKLLNISRLVFLTLPFLFLFFGVINVFNIFKFEEYISGNTLNKVSNIDREKGSELVADTRTFLYIEVIESAVKNNYVLFGRTPARGNDSISFGDYSKEILKTGKQERFANEVSILNIFTWLGVVGVVLYYLIFIQSSYLAINHSNNIFIKLIGLNICFRWAYGFVEDFSSFDLSNIFLWIMIGMCFSKNFREMSNIEMKLWINSIINPQKQTDKKFIKSI